MKYKNINILFCLILFTTSCSKKLDTIPTQSINPSDALGTSDGVQVALVGSYFDLGDDDLYGGRAFVGPDLLGDADEISWGGTYQGFTQIYNKTIPVDNGFVESTWISGYAAINDANNVLSALSVVNATSKDRIEGEAKFIRGCIYFDLVRLYGKAYNDGTPTTNAGVPLVLLPTISVTPESKVKRSTVAEVYDQVIKDLSDAETKLPISNGFYATKYAAAAMLARVYLQKGDFTNAANAADMVITSNKFTLTSSYADAFPIPSTPSFLPNTTEDIFAMQVSPTSGTTNGNGVNAFQEVYSLTGRGDITINQNHLDLYEAADDRLNLFYKNDGSIYTSKWDNVYGNVHIIRLAEMYLIRAEANFRLSTSVGASALSDINTIRARVKLPALTSLTLPKILNERKLELAFEGFTLHDAKRTQLSIGLLPYNSPKLVYPIPKRERIVNPNLTQNEGY